MARIFIAWEIGDSLGHLARLCPIVNELSHRGHQLSFALAETTHLEFFTLDKNVIVLPAPSATGQWSEKEELVCNSSILLQRGYRDINQLMPLIRFWHGLYRLVKPDMYLFDYAPTALLAARGSNKPKVICGSGFGSLVPGQPDCDLAPWVEDSAAVLSSHESSVVKTIIKVCDHFKYDPVHYLSDMYRCDFSLMSCIPELDEYQRTPGATAYFHHYHDAGDLPRPRWSGNGGTKVFCYLKAHLPQTMTVLDILADGDFDAICYCAGLDSSLAEKYRRQGLKLYLEPVFLADMLSDAHIVVCHAGKELVSQSLRCGVPLLLLPGQLEQYHASVTIERLGAGLRVPHDAVREGIESRLDEIALDSEYREAAQRIAKKNQYPRSEEPLKRIIAQLERLLDK
jgi:hypothetical protein